MHIGLPQNSPSSLPLPLRDVASAFERSLRPLSGHCILRAAKDPNEEGGLGIVTLDEMYPQVGYVIASAARDEDISLGDLALIQVESMDIARVYQRVFHVIFKDGTDMLCEPDKADPILDAFNRRRRGENLRIRTLQLNGEGIQFETSDILSYQFAEMHSAGWSAMYPEKVRLFKCQFAGETERIYYHIHESEILCLLK